MILFIVRFPVFESVLIGAISTMGDTLRGELIRVKYDVESRLPFVAVAGGKYKFAAQSGRLPAELAGKWQTTMYKESGDSSDAIGVFSQTGSDIFGSFATNYGDYRFLSGIVDGDSLFMSGFDGSGAYLFKARYDKVTATLTGDMYAGQKKSKAGKPFATMLSNSVIRMHSPTSKIRKPASVLVFQIPKAKKSAPQTRPTRVK